MSDIEDIWTASDSEETEELEKIISENSWYSWQYALTKQIILPEWWHNKMLLYALEHKRNHTVKLYLEHVQKLKLIDSCELS